MRQLTKAVFISAATLTLATVGMLAGRAWRRDRDISALERRLTPGPTEVVFDEVMIEGLPETAQRYLRRAIAPGTTLATSVRIEMTGRMKPSPDADFVNLQAEEVLTPRQGFVWRARLNMNGLPVRVVDSYDDQRGEVVVQLFGLIPIATEGGDDIARSTRGRVAGESVWIPSMLLPAMGATWEEIDDEHARVTVTVDGEKIPLTLTVDPEGMLREITMMRHGDVGVEGYQSIPYGFVVEKEAIFHGYRIPALIRGGWWYGTDRYAAEQEASFTVRSAEYR